MTITIVSADSAGNEGNNASYIYSVSAGRYVAFYSTASNLVVGDTNGVQAVFVKDLQTAGDVLANYDSATDITTVNLYVKNDATVDGRLLLAGDHHNLILGDLIA